MIRKLWLAALTISTMIATFSCAGDGSPTGAAEPDEPPTVEIVAPKNDTTLVEGSEVVLAGSATDAVDGDLSQVIAWSSDRDGALGVGRTVSAQLTVGTHTIRAAVTDSEGQTATASVAVEVTPDAPPSVMITYPSEGTVFTEAHPITFAGSASDREEGDLSEGLVWSSDVDGDLGTGPSISVELTVGAHTISARVTDSRGQVDTDRVEIEVRAEPPPAGTTRAYMAHFYFPEAGPTSVPFSPDSTRQLVETNDWSVEDYFARVSRDAVLLDVDYSGLLPLEKTRATFQAEDPQGGTLWRNALEVLAEHIDLSEYELFVLMLPHLEFGYPGARALTGMVTLNVDSKPVTLRLAMLGGNDFGGYNPVHMTHEIGHTYGLGHSSQVRCASPSIGPVDVLDPMWCGPDIEPTYYAYGDWYDAMGAYRGDPNIFWKLRAGWIDATDVVEIDVSTTVSLSPADTGSASPRGASLPLAATQYGEISYWIEYRTLPIRDLLSHHVLRTTDHVQIRRNIPRLVDHFQQLRGDLTLLDTILHAPGEQYHDPYTGVRLTWQTTSGAGPAQSQAVVDIDVSRIAMSATPEGGTLRVELTNGESDMLTLNGVRIGGHDASDITVLEDGCSNLELEPAESCLVRVEKAHPSARASVIVENSDPLRPMAAVSLTELDQIGAAAVSGAPTTISIAGAPAVGRQGIEPRTY